jgi:hypothetical protein
VRIASLLAATATLLFASWTGSAAQTIGVPDVSGDQLLYVYDARTSRVPFLTVANPSDDPIFVDVAFYPQNLSSRLGGGVIELGAAANRVIDPTSDFGGVANGNAGLAVLTPVLSATDATPVVPPEPLVGGFTLANTQLGSGFGENPFARFAVTSSGERASPGSTVDGGAVSYERIAPSILVVPVYFNPQTLAPPDQDGNRVILVTFADDYGTPFEVAGRSDTASAKFFDASGVVVAETTVPVAGVLTSNLQAIAGGPDVLTGSGKVFFDVEPGDGSYFGLFSQSLGTFASGQRLPEAFIVPTGTTGPVPTPTPTGPVVPPTPTGPGTPPPPTPPTQTPPAGACSVTITVTFDNSATAASGVAASLAYPGYASIPGTGNEDDVLARVTNLTGVASGLFGVGDQDSDPNDASLSIGLVSPGSSIPPGTYARVAFDCTSAPSAGDFSCTADVSDDLGLTLPSQCSVSVP